MNIRTSIYENHSSVLLTGGRSISEKCADIGNSVKKICCCTIAIFGDLLLLPVAGALALFAKCYKSNFDPTVKKIKKNKTPVLCIHGNGYNEMQWVFGRYFLGKKENCGSIFSLNLDGLISNNPNNGIEEYAKKVREKVLEIRQLTGRNDIILLGHSMGGLVAAHFAESLASGDSVQINKVITVSTPWKIPPRLKKLTKLTKRCAPSLFHAPKRYREMRDEENFLSNLRDKASKSPIKYYSIYSTGDPLVTGEVGKLSDLKPSRSYTCHGHYTPMGSPTIWKQIQTCIEEE